ncbi:bacillithiol biosynthesis cysteine-adding enzyme BshC [Staphylococcus lutrae]|uniref:Putative cysteine ligase BshC n=1 Tax=Staphylococcus lutrae TaxID=155085 RepID=A0AAC9WK76_9STAP|nr:bacillithiol biosynthesis cysteine-adding enzyme BshC [Staphylococcus lutrae]ARJ51601.1 bacillithiol biosynthesis cysteine-adding enzyme BshC [Staphylococcus lutrae]PNZ36755.1 bacillithiol biosynthesis cysteine-adding enzyme BshC [Staphylococcus lutrae]
MDCLNMSVNESDSFIAGLIQQEQRILQFFDYDPTLDESYQRRMQQPSNGRERQLAQVIRQYMADLDLTVAQEKALHALEHGAKVVIGGQQAGLFTGPLYTFHKIVSIIVKARELEATYQTEVVPVFWIAGEDHDFGEVDHTYVMHQQSGRLEKVKYHTMHPPESNITRYQPNKEALKQALTDYFAVLPETTHTKTLYNTILKFIEQSDHWTSLFKKIVQACFKSSGLLLIDAQFEALREMEIPLLQQLIDKHEQIDQAFRTQQQRIVDAELAPMIHTDSNVHLFMHYDGQRQLLKYENGVYHLSKSEMTFHRETLLDLVQQSPDLFSNNVVTRPIAEEWLFNTVAFIGGPSEIKYWAELQGVFHTMEIEMPIVLPRMRMTYLTPKVEKLLKTYQLDASELIINGTEAAREQFIRAQASDAVLEDIRQMRQQQQDFYEKLCVQMGDSEPQRKLLKKNHQIQMKQNEYLETRYLKNIERENEISMRHFQILSQTLHPMGGLQERIWNPLQLLNEFGMEMYTSSTFPPLRYTFQQSIIKT